MPQIQLNNRFRKLNLSQIFIHGFLSFYLNILLFHHRSWHIRLLRLLLVRKLPTFHIFDLDVCVVHRVKLPIRHHLHLGSMLQLSIPLYFLSHFFNLFHFLVSGSTLSRTISHGDLRILVDLLVIIIPVKIQVLLDYFDLLEMLLLWFLQLVFSPLWALIVTFIVDSVVKQDSLEFLV